MVHMLIYICIYCYSYEIGHLIIYPAELKEPPRMSQRRWCSGIMQDSHSCDPGSIPGRRTFLCTLQYSFPKTVVAYYYIRIFNMGAYDQNPFLILYIYKGLTFITILLYTK